MTSSELGGAERVVLDWLEFGDDRLSKIVIIPKQGKIIAELNRLNLPYEIIELNTIQKISRTKKTLLDFGKASIHLIAYMLKLFKITKKYRCQIIYSHGLKADFFSGLLSFFFPIKVVWHLHVYCPRTGLFAAIYKRLSKRVSMAIANSRSVSEWSQKVILTEMKTIYCGIRTDYYQQIDKGIARQTLNLSWTQDHFLIGMVSALAPWKGIDVFLSALPKVKNAFPKLTAIICGEVIAETRGHEKYDQTLKELAETLGLSSVVAFLPFQKNPSAVYSILDIFVHCSKEPEPFGRVVSEARLCGTPVIATKGGGVTEQIESGINGILVPMGCSTSLAEALLDLMKKTTKRTQIGQKGKHWVNNHLGIDRFVAQVDEVMKNLLGSPLQVNRTNRKT